MPEEDHFLEGEFYTRDEIRRGIDKVIDEFVLIDEDDIPDA